MYLPSAVPCCCATEVLARLRFVALNASPDIPPRGSEAERLFPTPTLRRLWANATASDTAAVCSSFWAPPCEHAGGDCDACGDSGEEEAMGSMLIEV